MAPPPIHTTDPVIPVCLFPAVLHFSKPTKRKRERVCKRKTNKRESLREKERQRGTMAATHAATCLLPLLPPKFKSAPHHVTITARCAGKRRGMHACMHNY